MQTSTQWHAVQVVRTRDVNILPVDDLVGHEARVTCVCGPVRESSPTARTAVFQHASLDRREA